MAQKYKGTFDIPGGFSNKGSSPISDDMVVEKFNDLLSPVALPFIYTGMIVYSEAEKIHYTWNGLDRTKSSNWNPFGGISEVFYFKTTPSVDLWEALNQAVSFQIRNPENSLIKVADFDNDNLSIANFLSTKIYKIITNPEDELNIVKRGLFGTGGQLVDTSSNLELIHERKISSIDIIGLAKTIKLGDILSVSVVDFINASTEGILLENPNENINVITATVNGILVEYLYKGSTLTYGSGFPNTLIQDDLQLLEQEAKGVPELQDVINASGNELLAEFPDGTQIGSSTAGGTALENAGENSYVFLNNQKVSINSNNLQLQNSQPADVGKILRVNAQGYFEKEVLPKTSVPFYDATIGTGADYATIQDAVDVGAGKLKLISDLTITSDVTLPAGFNLVIDLNGFVLTMDLNVQIIGGSTNSVLCTSYSGVKNGEFRYSTDNNGGIGTSSILNSEARNIVIRDTSTVNLTGSFSYYFKYHYNLDYYFPNAAKHGITYAEDCNLIAGGVNCTFFLSSYIGPNKIINCTISGTSKEGDSLGGTDYLVNCNITINNNFRLSVSEKADNITMNGFGSLIVYKQGSNLFGVKNLAPSSNAVITNFECLIMSIRNKTKIKVSNGIIQLADIDSGGASNCMFTNIDFQSNLVIGNMSYSSFTDCQCVSIIQYGNSDYNVFRNITYTTTVLDSSLTTREWDVYQN